MGKMADNPGVIGTIICLRTVLETFFRNIFGADE